MINRYIDPSVAQDFHRDAMGEFNELLIGEQEAKLGMLVAMVSGLNIVLVGEPGGGKTTLAINAHKVIDGIYDDNVANVPPQSDLTPLQLIGGVTKVTKEINVQGQSPRTETTSATIEPIIKPGTQVIVANELNRINPYAVNAVLEVYESGTIVNSEGTHQLLGLEYSAATMNPSESRQGTFHISAATASRHAIGVELGSKKSDPERDRVISDELNGWEAQPVRSVIDIDTLHDIQLRARAGVAVPASLQREAVDAIKKANDGLQRAGIYEADPRFARQIARLAKANATLHGEREITPADLKQALRFAVTARVGILGTRAARHGLSEEVASIVNGG